jgi:hypothetical protein
VSFVVIEFFVVVLPLLGFAIWEYLKVSRDLRKTSETHNRKDRDAR